MQWGSVLCFVRCVIVLGFLRKGESENTAEGVEETRQGKKERRRLRNERKAYDEGRRRGEERNKRKHQTR